MSVFVLAKKKTPLMPTSEKRGRQLFEKGRAVLIKMAPLTIRLKDRVDTVLSFVSKLRNIVSISAISMELVRFDMQRMESPEITGAEHQQAELQGYEVQEYLLEKWNRECAYYNTKQVPLEVEHIVPKSKEGSNSVSNLTLACNSCNQKKSSQPIEVFLSKKTEILQKITAKAKKPLNRVAVQACGNFNISTEEGAIQNIKHRYCELISRNDKYGYEFHTKTA